MLYNIENSSTLFPIIFWSGKDTLSITLLVKSYLTEKSFMQIWVNLQFCVTELHLQAEEGRDNHV